MSDHPLDQLNSHTPSSDSASSIVRIRRRDKFREFWSLSKSKTKEVKLKISNQSPHSRLSSQQLTRPLSVLSQASNLPSGDNQSTPSRTAQEKALSAPLNEARVLEMIFAENVPKPTMKTELPQLQQRIEMTQQLVYCNALLLRDTLSPLKAATGEAAKCGGSLVLREPVLDKTELDWIEATKKDRMEADRLRWLATRMVEEFVADAGKDSTKIADIIALGPVLEKEPYHKLLVTFIKEFDDSCTLDVVILQGLVQLVQDASPGYLVSDDLIKILGILRVHLQGTHQQSAEHSYHLTLAVSRILDVMADHKVQDLYRVLEHEPLSDVLSGLKGSSDPYLLYQACYAFQALQYVPDDESALRAVLRHSTGVVHGLVNVTAVFKLDLASVLEGLGNLQEALGGMISVAGIVYEGVSSLMESGRGVLGSLKEGLGSGQRRLWYPAVKAASAFAQAGQLEDLKKLIFEAPCRRDPLFQWGVCQLLGEIAVDPAWSISARQQTVGLFGHLCQHDKDWGQDESVKAWMLTIITKLGTSDRSVNATASALLQDLTVDQSALIKHPYPLNTRLPLPSASPLLAKVQNIQYLEYELHKFRLQRLAEEHLSVFIPPMAKANPQARDDDIFPLMEKVQEFLASDRHVMLILGDSGSGKSTFNTHLEAKLWKSYACGSSIPLFINLPAIDEPNCDMIEKQLRSDNFNDEQIRELKLHRQFILICDGYDESQQLVNLHKSNMLNQPGRWDTKMVISCRTQYLGQDYRSRFMPQSRDHYAYPAVELFQEAVITPFSREQIQSYIEQYVPLEPRTWTTKDYMDRLTTIPNLMDLVRNPFVLTLALEALPLVTEGKQDLSAIDISRVQLYDTFVKHWLDVNKRRLESNALSAKDREILDQLLEAGFTSMGVDYSIGLASAIFEKQNGNPVVRYTHLKDNNTWRVDFFGPDPEVRLLRESSPLTRSGSLFRFLHRSMQEYFYSRSVFDPSSHDDHDQFGPQSDIGSTDPALLDTEGPLFKRNLLTEPSVIQFLCERVKQHPDFEKQLLAVIEQSKTDATVATAAANAISILVRAGVRFNSADLRGSRIKGADLSDGQFDHAEFQGADLRGVNFARSWLRRADFGNAQMDGVRFEELPHLDMQTLVKRVAFSPNGKMFAVCLGNGGVITYDTTTWTRVHQYEQQSKVTSFAFSPNNQHLAFGNKDTTCRLWDSVSGETLLVMEGHTKWLRSVAFSPCGKQIASGSDDSTIRLWSSETGECLFVLNGHEKAVLSAEYSADGRRLVSTSHDGTIRVWDPETGAPEADWVIPHVHGTRVAPSSDGKQFALRISERRNEICLMDAITGETGLILSDDGTRVQVIVFSPIGDLIVSSSEDETVRLWDSSSGQLISRFTGHGKRITTCAISPDGLQIASGDLGGIIRLWEVNINRSSPVTQKRAEGTAAYSHDGLFVISYHDDYTVLRWDSSTGASRSIPCSSTFDVISVAISPNGRWFANGCRNGNIRLLNVRTDVDERLLLGPSSDPIIGLSFSRCGRWLASCDRGVLLWDLDSTNDQVKVVAEASDEHARAYVAFSPAGDQIAVAFLSRSARIRLFDPRATDFRQPLKELCLSDTLFALNYSPDGQRLVIGTGISEALLLWDLQSDKPNVKLEGHTDTVNSVAYSPCSKWILSGSDDKTVRLWSGEVDSWSCVAVVSGCLEAVVSVAWNPVVPLEFVTGSKDGSVRVWQISGAKAGDVSVRMQWGSHIGRLCITDLTFKGAVGLSPIYSKLLVQRGAIGASVLPEGDEPEEGKSE
ncbi:hypothetical protein KI688_011272 [Linnemannia hyalina]|uniref:WD40 repeat-like protein n=1 Tax=Linnemannia hyalina TaxID=64524 RepID=A0A9P7XUT4_9FUNG|nr:hypothetical protein KI688_011272 [Linnemannia hyalina]